MKKPKTAKHYYFSTARMIEQAEYKKSGKWQPMATDNPLVLDSIEEAMRKSTDPIRIPRTACNIYMAELSPHSPPSL